MSYRNSAAGAVADTEFGVVEREVAASVGGPAERRPARTKPASERAPVSQLLELLVDAGLGQVEVFAEYRMPGTARRLDLLVAGIHPETGAPSYLVFEVERGGGPGATAQLRSYCDYLVSTNSGLRDHPERVAGLVYQAGARPGGAPEASADDRIRVFTPQRHPELVAFLRSRLAPVSGAFAADQLVAAELSEPRPLIAAARAEVRENEQFVLLAEQRIAHDAVLAAVARTRSEGGKRAVVITGGAGTGKSVVALSLLGELSRAGTVALHATGSKVLTTALRKSIGGARGAGLFRYFNSFAGAERNSVDVLICDEAHRLRETSANRYTRAADRTGRSQIGEIMEAARVSVFLLDERQSVRPGEIGTLRELLGEAARLGIPCTIVELGEVFRGNGSEEYPDWVSGLLDPTPGERRAWVPDGRYRLGAVESPQEMEEFLAAEMAAGRSARLTAGFCWPWHTGVRPGQPLPADVVIGDWARPWNVAGDRAVGDAPPAAAWATDPRGFGQIGSVYTTQGMEYDWNGVIFGPDLVWRADRWQVDRTASKDPVFTRRGRDVDVDAMIRNTYRVLLTRGMLGTLLYSTDAETRAKFRELCPPIQELRP
ncbi:DUF2075 domain-containing protein [Kitasatospora sp. NBC_01287]|uniref:DUF2075 domain-containing protein n=1 Tax=Kitasatospora sp. NBC_01287 TaxID=2903573 RepID=UPI00224DF2C3|nr:DUF2075 domain-containing protein [Kitasatospora sp. NBC_01287]MCX4749568.1 DUF2075 domain-containing protein [Kitasatospora sp. NBC_01287]